MTRNLRQNRSRLAACVMLVAYVCTLPALLPVMFAAVARVEGSHGVEISASGEGARVVLTHPSRCAAKAHDAIHRHCLAARLLASFSAPGEGPDHVVKFASAVSRLVERRLAPPEAPLSGESAAPDLVVPCTLPLPPQCTAGFPPECSPLIHGPPAAVVELRSTLLLI